MFEFIEKLRQKSDRTKKQIAFLVSFFFAGVIFVIWLSVLYPSLKEREKENDSDVAVTPSSAIGSTFSDGISSIIKEFKRMKESISLIGTDPAYYVSTTTDTSSGMTASVYQGNLEENSRTNSSTTDEKTE